jgi:hypothetical protein
MIKYIITSSKNANTCNIPNLINKKMLSPTPTMRLDINESSKNLCQRKNTKYCLEWAEIFNDLKSSAFQKISFFAKLAVEVTNRYVITSKVPTACPTAWFIK